MCGKGRLEALGIALQHARHLGEAEAESTEGYDLGGATHLVGTIGPPPGRAANRDDQAALLIEPQGLDGHAKPPCGFGSVQEFGGRAHD